MTAGRSAQSGRPTSCTASLQHQYLEHQHRVIGRPAALGPVRAPSRLPVPPKNTSKSTTSLSKNPGCPAIADPLIPNRRSGPIRLQNNRFRRRPIVLACALILTAICVVSPVANVDHDTRLRFRSTSCGRSDDHGRCRPRRARYPVINRRRRRVRCGPARLVHGDIRKPPSQPRTISRAGFSSCMWRSHPHPAARTAAIATLPSLCDRRSGLATPTVSRVRSSSAI
jgi:hypothetical protein